MTEDPEVPDEAASAAEIDLTEAVAAEETSADQEKCIKQCALTVEKNVKYLSSQVLALMGTQDQSIVETATKTTKNSRN